MTGTGGHHIKQISQAQNDKYSYSISQAKTNLKKKKKEKRVNLKADEGLWDLEQMPGLRTGSTEGEDGCHQCTM